MPRHPIRLLVLLCVVGAWSTGAFACTAAVILGSATSDGRPLLWKNRDTGERDNEIVRFGPREINGESTLAFVAVTNAGSTLPWGGVNEAGFAIINTLTTDMRVEGAKGQGNGSFMRDALRWCRSVEDFERRLERTTGKRSTIATFSVIDAHGRGVTYEVGPDRHVAFDAGDPEVAAASCVAGAVVRSNFTFTAKGLAPGDSATDIKTKSYGRFARAQEILGGAGRPIDLRFMLEHAMRDLGASPTEDSLIDTRETISRRTSVCGILIQGVRPGEDPRAATMWVMLGEPALSVAIPAWAALEKTSPIADGPETSALCDVAEALRARVYARTEKGTRLDMSFVPGVHEDTIGAERTIVDRVGLALKRWRTEGIDTEEMATLHHESCAEALLVLQREVVQATRPGGASPKKEPAGTDPAGSEG